MAEVCNSVNAWYVGSDPVVKAQLVEAWGLERAVWTFFSTGSEAAGIMLASPPDILVCDRTLVDMSGLVVARMLKEENVYSQVPVILCLTQGEAAGIDDWGSIGADDFFLVPGQMPVLRARLELALVRSFRTLDANPLTRLPGNTSIIRRTQCLIEQSQDFALGYCDLDQFKPFNDKYGFSRGDEVLMMTSRVICNTVNNFALPFSFVGHVGGDDYVFIVPVGMAETVCQGIISAFDGIIPQFYDDEDIRAGGIISTDRQNVVRSFPLMAVSIAVVCNKNGSLKHYGEAFSLAMALKKVAKKSEKSNYVFDKRLPNG